MKREPKSGDTVSWNSHGGEAHGTVVKKLTKPTTIKGHKADASPDEPQYLVETNEGKRTAHKAAALKPE